MDEVTAGGIAAQVDATAARAATSQPGATQPGADQAAASQTGAASPDQPASQPAAAQQPAANQPGQTLFTTAPASQPGQPANSGQPDSQPAAAQAAPVDTNARPITDWKQVGDLGVDVAALDTDMVQSFSGPAVECGLTPDQCRALVKWQTEYVKARHEARLEQGRQELVQRWGKDAGANVEKVKNFCLNLDRQPGLAGFTEAFIKSGGADSPLVVAGLHAIAKAFDEDSAGRLAPVGDAPETAYDGIRSAFARARSGRA